MITFQEIPPGPGRRIAVADIHGCRRTLQAMLEERLQITRQDQVFLLGDYITRGPASLGVIQYLIDLQAGGYQLYTLRGNHEQNFLDAREEGPEALQLYLDYYELHDFYTYGEAHPEIFAFIETLPYYFVVDHFYLVHAGLNLNASAPFRDFDSMLTMRDYEPDAQILNGKHIIHGHQPHYLATIRKRIAQKAPRIPLDNGIAHDRPHPRMDISRLQNLCALDLDRFELFVQPNAE